MRKVKNILLIVTCISTLTITSCKKEGCTDSNAMNYNSEAEKDDGSCTYKTVEKTPFTAKIDGEKFVHTDLTAVKEPSFGMPEDVINITAEKGDAYIEIKVPHNISTGTYTFDDGQVGSITGIYEDGIVMFSSEQDSGSLKISSNSDGNISGTFSFTGFTPSTIYADQYVEITEGKFDVDYQ